MWIWAVNGERGRARCCGRASGAMVWPGGAAPSGATHHAPGPQRREATHTLTSRILVDQRIMLGQQPCQEPRAVAHRQRTKAQRIRYLPLPPASRNRPCRVGPTHWRCLQLVAELRLSTVRQQWLQDSGAADQPLAHTTMLSSGASAPLTPTDDAELASVCTTLDTWAMSVRDPAAWPAHPHAAEWDRQSAADYFQRCTKSEAVRL